MPIILLFFSIIVFLFSIFKFNKGYIYYLILSLISLYSFFISLACLDVFHSEFSMFWSNQGVVHNSNYVSLYTFCILFFYLLSIFFCDVFFSRNRIDINFFRNKISNFDFKEIVFFVSIFLLIVNLFYFYIIKWDIFWFNDTYLLIASTEGLRINNILTQTLHMLAPLNGLICCIFFALSIVFNNKKTILILFLPVIFFLLLKIGDHSRLSSLYFGVMAIILYFSNKNMNNKIIFPILLIISYFCLLNSLTGRSLGFHGFSAITKFFDNIYLAFVNGEYLNSFGNIFEGAFVHGESFEFLNYQYPQIFKILSFSPFPSLVDGYNTNAHHYSLRLHTYVPMGATGELLIFGIQYVFIYFMIVFFSIYTSIKVFNKNYLVVFLISLFLIILASYLQFTYPIRNILRFLYIAIFINLMALYIPRFRWGKV